MFDDWPQECAFMSQFLKIWADRYPFNGEMKGAHAWIEPGSYILIITSNYSIDECNFNETDKQAIKERFTEVFIDESPLWQYEVVQFDIFVCKGTEKRITEVYIDDSPLFQYEVVNFDILLK